MAEANVAQTFYVVMPAQPPDVGASIRPMSKLLAEDEQAVRTRLVTPYFQVLSRFARHSNADGLKGQLAAFGVKTFIVSDDAVRGHLFMWCASARTGAGGMALADFGKTPFYCSFDDIIGVSIMTVPREDGTTTKWVDLHRRSSPVTPRLDTAMFDFPSLVNRADATLENFLDLLESSAQVTVERGFDAVAERFAGTINDFATKPAEFAPPASALSAPYEPTAALAANLFSFLVRSQIASAG